MRNIPTAEEFFYQTTGVYINHKDIKTAMIEFTKLHVKAALKAAFEDAPCGSSTDIVTCEELHEAIINSYALENIQ